MDFHYKVDFDFFQTLKNNFNFKIKGGFTLNFFGVQEPQIRNQVPRERENRKIADKRKVNQITLLWGSASKRNRKL